MANIFNDNLKQGQKKSHAVVVPDSWRYKYLQKDPERIPIGNFGAEHLVEWCWNPHCIVVVTERPVHIMDL